MNREPKIGLFSEAECASARPELAPIAGKRVAIIGRFQDGNGDWNYTVYASRDKTSPTFTCIEAELVPVVEPLVFPLVSTPPGFRIIPMPLVSDSEHVANVVVETARLRYSVVFEGLRRLLQERGYDPMKCIQISIGPGDDVYITLVLPDGTVVGAEYREHYETRQAFRFVDWQVQTFSDREIELCREILSKNDTSEFDADVRHFFEEHLAATDSVLAPLKWGSRQWHTAEEPPRQN